MRKLLAPGFYGLLTGSFEHKGLPGIQGVIGEGCSGARLPRSEGRLRDRDWSASDESSGWRVQQSGRVSKWNLVCFRWLCRSAGYEGEGAVEEECFL